MDGYRTLPFVLVLLTLLVALPQPGCISDIRLIKGLVPGYLPR